MDRWARALRLAGVGWFVAMAIALGIVGGLWLDGIVGTTPLFTLVGLGLGLVVAFRGIYQLLKPLTNRED